MTHVFIRRGDTTVSNLTSYLFAIPTICRTAGEQPRLHVHVPCIPTLRPNERATSATPVVSTTMNSTVMLAASR